MSTLATGNSRTRTLFVRTARNHLTVVYYLKPDLLHDWKQELKAHKAVQKRLNKRAQGAALDKVESGDRSLAFDPKESFKGKIM